MKAMYICYEYNTSNNFTTKTFGFFCEQKKSKSEYMLTWSAAMSWKLSHIVRALIMLAAWSKGMFCRRGMLSLGLVKAAIRIFPGWGGSMEVRPLLLGLLLDPPPPPLVNPLHELFELLLWVGFGLGLLLLVLLLLLLFIILSPFPFAAPPARAPFLCLRYLTCKIIKWRFVQRSNRKENAQMNSAYGDFIKIVDGPRVSATGHPVFSNSYSERDKIHKY